MKLITVFLITSVFLNSEVSSNNIQAVFTYSNNAYVVDKGREGVSSRITIRLNDKEFSCKEQRMLLNLDHCAEGKPVIKKGDISEDLNTCNEQSGFYCFEGLGMYFAVPRDKSFLNQKWSINNIECNLVKYDFDMMFVGEKYYSHLISCGSKFEKSKKFNYIYSPLKGLLAFYYLEINTNIQINNIFYLRNKIGFGSHLLENKKLSE
jgi:hypothetical protein